MFIFIEAVTGYKVRLKVIPEDTIQNIKYRIMVCDDLPLEEQHLIYQYKDLENHRTLEYYHISNDATIKLIMKLKGGPVSLYEGYEDLITEHNAKSLCDQLTFIFLENGELRFFPVMGLEMQSKMLKQTKDDLNDPSIFSSYNEPLNDQKLTILKLKMDCIRLGKKLSSLSRQQDMTKTIQINNDNQQSRSNKSVNSILHRSISLDSRHLEFTPDISNNFSKFRNPSQFLSSRYPPNKGNGIYRTMSVADDIKTNKPSIMSFPPIQNLSRIQKKSNKFIQSYKDSLDIKIAQCNPYESRRRLPPLNESEYENKRNISIKSRCPICSKKMSLANEFVCRCGGHYCSRHKFPEEHNCLYDFKYNGRQELMRSNPLIEAKKIEKL